MALVGYDYSDDSDEGELKDEDSSTIRKEIPVPTLSNVDKAPRIVGVDTASIILKQPIYRSTNAEEEDDDSSNSDSDDDKPIDISFSSLPKPQYDTLSVQNLKNKSYKSEIWKKLQSAPQVKKTTITKKKAETNNKESGLLSMLPSPSNESTRKIGVVISNTKLLPTAVKNRITSKESSQTKEIDESEKSGSDSDFFNLSKLDENPEYDSSLIDLNIDLSDPAKDVNVPKKLDVPARDTSRVSLLTKYLRENDVSNEEPLTVDEVNQNSESQSRMDLDDDAVLKLCGRKRKIPDDIQVIDIQEDDIIAETRRNLTKRLTEEVPSRPIRAGPSTLSKRKHQITYLAFQAKERELELKNQWANNRFTKRQTQSKYGF